jgi:tetratricopeptide (TPR) repeat protein
VLGNLGLANQEKGDYERAIGYYNQNMELARQQNDIHSEAIATGLIGYLLERLWRLDEAIAAYKDSYDRLLRLGDTYGQLASLNNIANTYAKMRQFSLAVEAGELALRLPEGSFTADFMRIDQQAGSRSGGTSRLHRER